MFSTGVPEPSGSNTSGGDYDLTLFHDEQGRAAVYGHNAGRAGAASQPTRHKMLWTGTKVHARSADAFQEAALVVDRALTGLFAQAADDLAAERAAAQGLTPAAPPPAVPEPELLPSD